jgi:hypothetical protein
MGHISQARNLVIVGDTGLASERSEDGRMDQRRPETKRAEIYVYCKSCHHSYTILCDQPHEDEYPDLCGFCGSRAEAKDLWR